MVIQERFCVKHPNKEAQGSTNVAPRFKSQWQTLQGPRLRRTSIRAYERADGFVHPHHRHHTRHHKDRDGQPRLQHAAPRLAQRQKCACMTEIYTLKNDLTGSNSHQVRPIRQRTKLCCPVTPKRSVIRGVHLIENFFAKLKEFKGIAMRCEKNRPKLHRNDLCMRSRDKFTMNLNKP